MAHQAGRAGPSDEQVADYLKQHPPGNATDLPNPPPAKCDAEAQSQAGLEHEHEHEDKSEHHTEKETQDSEQREMLSELYADIGRHTGRRR